MTPSQFRQASFLRHRYRLPRFLPLGWSLRVRERTGIASVYHPRSVAKKVIFIHVPKAAGSSIGRLVFGTDIIGHYPYFVYQRYDPLRFEDYYKFSLVRSPLTRLFSAYRYVLSGGKGRADAKCGDVIRAASGSFEDFVCNVLDQAFAYRWVHFVPQSFFLCTDADKLMVDDVVKVESLPDGFEPIGKRLGISASLHGFNRQDTTPIPELGAHALAKVHSIYRRDYRNFGYPQERATGTSNGTGNSLGLSNPSSHGSAASKSLS
ncbi:sulfotransferase family 2 domain-containing protein [Crateriforma conspicua]|uniref:Sulfotransferase family protein n=1 Tax=Crateriforma conspicua TaxID=2527996 RepID=A0A5C6FKR8_9PLAN|nr:sulfotransferase family 2 domain-containing protein [Crateriforma conspicua]TWU61722.1 Sulfotransferase family protein [Crateriforma conspicua]